MHMVADTDQVGIGTETPQATLDVNGFVRLNANVVEPVVCDGARAGSVALTSGYGLCACNGLAWVFTHDGLACVW